MTCFLCEKPIPTPPPGAVAGYFGYGYFRREGGPALPHHNDCGPKTPRVLPLSYILERYDDAFALKEAS